MRGAYSAKTEHSLRMSGARCSARNGSLPCWLIKLLAFYTSIRGYTGFCVKSDSIC